MSNHLLEAINLSVGYPPKVLASGIALELQAREVVAVLSLNGAGKTTLLRTLAGLQPKVAGDVKLNGLSIWTLSARQLARQRSIVMAGRQHVVGEVKVRELLEMTGKVTPDDAADKFLDKALELMQLEKFYERKLNTLSDGEYQRVMIARALVQRTPLILMDEPTAHLDVVNTMETFSHIHRLPEMFGVSVLFSTHDIEKALQIAQRCLVIGADGAIYQGTPDELINQNVIARVFTSNTVHFNNSTRSFEYSQSL